MLSNNLMDEATPLVFYLSQNYPNPFREKTVIKYCVAYKTRVVLTIYNPEGKEIERLIDEEKKPGTYEVEFVSSSCHSSQSRNLADGYYYYQMTADEYISEKKWFCINKLSGRFNMKSLLQTLFFFLLVTQICFGQWLHQYCGTNRTLNGSYFLDNNKGWIVGESGLVMKTTNAGLEWISQSSQTNQHLSKVSFVDSVTGWICGSGGTILKTTNAGNDWIMQVSGTNNSLGDIYFYNSKIGWAVGGSWQTYYSIILNTTDGGLNWSTQLNDAGPYLYDLFFIDSITGWAVGDYSKILKTTDAGLNWITQYEEGSWEPGFLCVFFTDYNNGWVVGWDGAMMRTSDGGNNWVICSSNLWGETLDDIFFVDSDNGWIVGGGFYKMLKTTDGGDNWFLENIPMSSGLTSIYLVDSDNGWATGSNGTILHTTNAGVTFIEEEFIETKPNNISLLQNYPNPFNPSTTFKYSIPDKMNVKIKLYDISGTEIETLINEEKPSGTYEVNWNAAKLPSGVYFYQLKAGDFISTKKMILIK
jgi:photosystem II stability/assembly factor-like uncharacterized protein